MKLGFTGTRKGMNAFQRSAVRGLLVRNIDNIEEAHHGDCIGADEEFHDMFRVWVGVYIVSHPCTLRHKRAFCVVSEERPSKSPLVRNRDIVDDTDEMWAAPLGKEIKRSGTWSTIRYAKMRGKKVTIIYPDCVRVYVGRWMVR